MAIAYSPKVRTAMECGGLGEFCLGLEGLTAEDLLTKLQACYSKRDEIRNKLQKVSKEMERRAIENAEIAVKLLNEQGWRHAPSNRLSEILPSLVVMQTKRLVQREVELLQREKELEAVYEALRKLARSLIDNKKEYGIAEELVRALLGIWPNNSELNYLLAYCLHAQRKDLQKALEYYTLALQLGFYEFWVRFDRGSLHMELGNYEEAQADLTKAVALNSSHVEARERLDEVMKRISEPQTSEARTSPDLQAQPVEKEQESLGSPVKIQTIQTLEAQLAEREAIIANLTQQLALVYNSRRYRLASRLAEVYWKIKRLLNFMSLNPKG